VTRGSDKYQPHIDGLRAVAVLAVVLYHFGSTWFGGGYVGVDVFFVISGFLITRLILGELYESSRFDFGRFYVRRMRRLLPALFTTLAGSLAAAVALFSPEQFQRFGRSLAAAVFSGSNILFWTESGYFDVDSHLKPLLHTWSLGVEEQFYLVWPALLWLMVRRTTRRWHPWLLAGAAAASFALNGIWATAGFDVGYRSTMFFLTPFRIFELALGALAIYAAPVLAGRRVRQEFAMAAGLLLIGWSVVAYTDDLVFPYYYALVPCVGAFLVIVSGGSRIAGRLLTNPVAVWIGLISYSLYLVHWPALVFYEYHRHGAIARNEYAAGFVAILAAAALLYRFVETPLRQRAGSRSRPMPQLRFALGCVATALAMGLLGVQIGASAGWAWRAPGALTARAVAEGKQRRFDLYNAGCQINYFHAGGSCKPDRPFQVLVVGDSHEPDGYNALAAMYGKDPNVDLIAFGSFNDCATQYGPDGWSSAVPGCQERVAMLNDRALVSSLDAVVFSQNVPFHPTADIIWRVIGDLQRRNPRISVVVLGGYLILKRDCSEVFSERHSFSACADPDVVGWNAFGERNAGYSPPPEAGGLQFLYIDRMRLLCADGTLGSCVMEAYGEPAFYDGHHLSLGFATYVGKRIGAVYADQLRAAGFPEPAS
jgi:peptidoglycan/LPS O-acetylase OafA/YrhL